MTKEFIFPIQLYTDDIDFYGVVHHTHYLMYMERARNEWVCSLGYSLSDLAKENICSAIRAIELEYLHPARLGDKLEVTLNLEKIGRSSMVFNQSVRSQTDPTLIFCKGRIVGVCVNDKMQLCHIPETLLEKINGN